MPPGTGPSIAIKLVMCCVAVANASAQVISDITVDEISHSSARITWNTDVTSDARVFYHLKTNSCPAANLLGFATSTKRNALTHGMTVGGLKPGSTYCFAPRSGETFGPVDELTTRPEPADRFRDPTLPALVDTSLPAIDGSTFEVDPASGCNGPDGLQAQLERAVALADDRNHQVVIPAGTTCVGPYLLPPRTGTGWITVRTSTSDSKFTPEGVRTGPPWSPRMATLTNPMPSTPWATPTLKSADGGTARWRLVGIQFTADYKSDQVDFKDVTNSSPVQITTLNPHGWADGDVIQIWDVEGHTALNGSKRITVTGSDTFSVDRSEGNAQYRGGGKAVRNPIYNWGLVALGLNSSDIVLDRVWINGRGFPYRHVFGVLLQCNGCALIESYISGVTFWRAIDPDNPDRRISNGNTFASSAIDVTTGGPLKIYNNHIEAGNGITIFAEGSPSRPVPADIEIRRNTITGLPSLRYNRENNPASDGRYYLHRQLLEFKRGKRIWIDGNLFDYQWSDGITPGHAVIFTPRFGFGGFGDEQYNPDNRISDVTFTNNIIRNSSGTLLALGADGAADHDTPAGARFKIANNLFYGIDGHKWKSTLAGGASTLR